ncbi:hypothetical protein ACJJIX_08425 [Microbulbifer sp. VAAC004]|uniref:hypothetical protein n=1 Tax=unclassified Microbulbifer TaxID=2619833 RepID=UPI00403A6B34
MINEKDTSKKIIKNIDNKTISDNSLRKAADKSEELVKKMDKKRIKRSFTEWA